MDKQRALGSSVATPARIVASPPCFALEKEGRNYGRCNQRCCGMGVLGRRFGVRGQSCRARIAGSAGDSSIVCRLFLPSLLQERRSLRNERYPSRELGTSCRIVFERCGRRFLGVDGNCGNFGSGNHHLLLGRGRETTGASYVGMGGRGRSRNQISSAGI